MTDYAKAGPEVRVNADGKGQQNVPVIATLADGRIAVAWSTQQLDGTGDDAAVVRVLGADGTPLTADIVIESSAAGAAGYGISAITALADGGFVVGYTTGFSTDAKVRIFSADGVPAGPSFTVHPPSVALEYTPELAAMPDGSFVSVWQARDADVTTDYDTYGRRFSADGTALTDVFRINVQTSGYQTGGRVIALEGGQFAVAWTEYNTSVDGSETAARVRLFDATGTGLTGEIAVNNITAGTQSPTDIFRTGDGGFGVIYSNRSRAAGTANGSLVQLFDAAGAKVGPERTLAVAPGKVALLDDGSFAVAYATAGTPSETFVQRYDADFVAVGSPDRLSFAIPGSIGSVGIAASATGFGVAYTTTDTTVDGDSTAILFQRYGDVSAMPGAGDDVLTAPNDANWTVSGGNGNDTLTGRGGDDRIHGGVGADRIDGGTGDDRLTGGVGNDVIRAGGGTRDVLSGGSGDDRLVGGRGFDLMLGGEGADTFAFGPADLENPIGAQDARIVDFSRAAGDRIDLSLIDARIGGADDAFTFIGTATFTGAGSELRIRYKDGFAFVDGDLDGDGRIDLLIKIDGATDLTAADFIL